MEHLGIVTLDAKLLLRILDLSAGSIVNAEWDMSRSIARLLVSHPSMPELREGDAIPEVHLVQTVTMCEHGAVTESKSEVIRAGV